jgi:ribosomal protein S14
MEEYKMSNIKRLHSMKQREDNICHICGVPNAHLRTFTNDDGICGNDCKCADMKNAGGIKNAF